MTKQTRGFGDETARFLLCHSCFRVEINLESSFCRIVVYYQRLARHFVDIVRKGFDMEIITEKVGAVFKMAINGRLVVSTTEAFKNALAEAISENQWIVLDLTEMSYIDSSGLGAMVFAQQKLSEKGGSLRLAGLQPKPRIVFDITKVYRIFEIFDNIETAIESFPTTE